MLKIRYKKNSESNILTSVILVMLMVMSTTLAMMIPTDWDEPTITVDVEYSPMESSPAMQSMNQAGQGSYDGVTRSMTTMSTLLLATLCGLIQVLLLE
jgi:hypothetical protein